MTKGETITSYFLRITEIKNQLSTMGNNVDDVELTLLALRGLPISWESFIECITGRPSLPKFDQLKNDCTQEESRLISRGIGPTKEGEIQALPAKANNKGEKNFKRKRGNHRYLSKVQCYKSDKFGHTHRFCPERKKNLANIAEVREEEYSLF